MDLLIRIAFVMLLASVFFAASVIGGGQADAASVTAKGTILPGGADLMKEPDSKSAVLARLGEGTEVALKHEIHAGSKKHRVRWYKVRWKGKTGYVEAGSVGGIRYGHHLGITVDDLEYRKGPGESFRRLGRIKPGRLVCPLLPASAAGKSGTWYKLEIKGKTAYLPRAYVALTSPPGPSPEPDLSGRPEPARSLLSDPTVGGKARYVYTFDTQNCKRLFAVRGSGGVTTAQGLAYTGKRYYVLFGNRVGQHIVTYSSKGKRIGATRFRFAIGHPNGMTWDPRTGLCYIFKGHQKGIYTWDPAKDSFGRSETMFNASGGAYDPSAKMIYASSLPCMYTYSSDGRFRLDAVYGRCIHSFKHSAQDCGAGGGFIFHCISGTDHRNVNYLDVYRICDRKYLGSIKITMGEVESAIVDRKGYVELLINEKGSPDHIWKTPPNIKDLK